MKLSLKQKAFADYYIELGNAYQAAIKAGYSENYAKGNVSKLLENVRVKEYIDIRLKQLEDERIASAAEVMKYLTGVMRGESESEIVVIEGEGDGCSSARRMQKAPDEKERLKAAELLGKRFGMFKDTMDLTVKKSEKLADIFEQLGGEGLEE